MPASTTNYSFNLPVEGSDDDLWGGFLNDNWSDLDTILNSNFGQLYSNNRDTARPANIAAGGLWNDSATEIYYAFDGTDDIPLFQLNTADNWTKWILDFDLDSYIQADADDVVHVILGGALEAIFSAGATAPEAETIITREKGDARYAAIDREWTDVETIAATGATIETSDFEAGYDYRVFAKNVNHSGGSQTQLYVSLYKTTAAAYTGYVRVQNLTTALNVGSANIYYGVINVNNPLGYAQNFYEINGGGGGVASAGIADDAELSVQPFVSTIAFAISDTITRARFRMGPGSSWPFSTGNFIVQRRVAK